MPCFCIPWTLPLKFQLLPQHYISSLSALYSLKHLPFSRSYCIYIAYSISPTRMYACWICWHRKVQDQLQSEFKVSLDNIDAWGPSYVQGCYVRAYIFICSFLSYGWSLEQLSSFTLKWSHDPLHLLSSDKLPLPWLQFLCVCPAH